MNLGSRALPLCIGYVICLVTLLLLQTTLARQTTFRAMQAVEMLLEGRSNGPWPKSLAMSGDGLTVAAGAPFLLGGGAVQIYARDASIGSTWQREALIKKPTTISPLSMLGTSVDLSYDGKILVSGDPYDMSTDNARLGGVLIFSRDTAGSWSQLGETLKETDKKAKLGLGTVVRCSVDCSTIVSTYMIGGQGGTTVFVKDEETNTWMQQGPRLNDGQNATQILVSLVVSSDGNHFLSASIEIGKGSILGGFYVMDRFDGIWSQFGSQIQERNVVSSAMTISSNGQFVARSALSAITIWQRGTDRYERLHNLENEQTKNVGIQDLAVAADLSLIVFLGHSQLQSYARVQDGSYLLSTAILNLPGGDPHASKLCLSADGTRAVVGIGHYNTPNDVGIFFLDKDDFPDVVLTRSPSPKVPTPSTPEPTHEATQGPSDALTASPFTATIEPTQTAATPSVRPSSQPNRTFQPISRAPVAGQPTSADPTKESGSWLPSGSVQVVLALIAITGLTVSLVVVVRNTQFGRRIRNVFRGEGGFRVFQGDAEGGEGRSSTAYDGHEGDMRPNRIEMRPMTSLSPPQPPMDLTREEPMVSLGEFSASSKTRLIGGENDEEDKTFYASSRARKGENRVDQV